jgi:hypothetical protein
MDSKWQFVCYLVAFVSFAVAVLPASRIRNRYEINLIALGLAAAVLPFLWNAAVAGW